MRKYTHETGAIISPDNKALYFIEGEVGCVDFPEELIWSLHKKSPGVVYKFAHVHPPRLKDPSSRDFDMLKMWAMALHPFPARLSVITQLNQGLFCESVYFGQFEAKDAWLQHKTEKRQYFSFIEEETPYYQTNPQPEWLEYLLKRSYE